MCCKNLFIKSKHFKIFTNNSSCRYKQKMFRTNFWKHNCCCSTPPLLPLQWFSKSLKSQALLLSKRGSQSCFYRTRKSISLRNQSSKLQCKSRDWFLSDKTTTKQLKITIILSDKNHPTDSQGKSLDYF